MKILVCVVMFFMILLVGQVIISLVNDAWGISEYTRGFYSGAFCLFAYDMAEATWKEWKK